MVSDFEPCEKLYRTILYKAKIQGLLLKIIRSFRSGKIASIVMQKTASYICILFSFLSFCALVSARSIHRQQDDRTPSITARWLNDTQTHTLWNEHIEEHTFFDLFDKTFFEQHMLPDGKLACRYNPETCVDTKILKNHIEKLLEEIKLRQKKYSHFINLQSKDFNRRKGHGLLIVKHKEYPFVVKVFIERPETFISPYHKGFEPIFFFYMGGGMNRHLSGFTRLKNLEAIKEKIAHSKDWSSRIDTPRKWYWIASDAPWIEVTGKNLGAQGSSRTAQIPGTYCIIADAIVPERILSILDAGQYRKIVLDLCNYLNLWIDPHLNNYMIERGTQKIVIVDTEHFPTVVGLKDPVAFDSYTSWYLHLTGKFLQNTFGQTKKERRHHQAWNECMRLV